MKTVSKMLSSLKGNVAVMNSFYLTIARFTRYGLMFIFTSICARYLGTNNYGIISYNFSLVGIITLLFSLGADTYIIVQLSKNRKSDKVNKLITINIVNRLFLIVVITLSIIILNNFVTIYSFDKVAIIIYLTAIIDTFRTVSDGFFQSIEKLKYIAWFEFARAMILLLGVIVIMQLDYGLVGVASLYLFSSAIFLILSYYLLFIKYKVRLVKTRFVDSIDIIKVAFPFFLSTAITMIATQLDVVMIGNIGGNVQTAYYTTAKKIIDIVLMAPSIIAMALLPKISNQEITKKNSNKIVKYIFGIGVVVSIGVFLFSKFVIILAFGKEYEISYHIIRVFCVGFPFIFVNSFLSTFLNGNGKQKKVLWVNVVGTVGNVVLNFILIPKYLSVGAAIATISTIFINYIQFTIYYKREEFNLKVECGNE